MSSRFFPDGGNGSGSTEYYKPKPGDIAPLFDAGYLTFSVENNGVKYIRITETAKERIAKRDGKK
jgi:DNA-binding PadR family transcriptional regulator